MTEENKGDILKINKNEPEDNTTRKGNYLILLIHF